MVIDRDPASRMDILDFCGRITRQFRQAHRQVPWLAVVATRNVMIHTYERV